MILTPHMLAERRDISAELDVIYFKNVCQELP